RLVKSVLTIELVDHFMRHKINIERIAHRTICRSCAASLSISLAYSTSPDAAVADAKDMTDVIVGRPEDVVEISLIVVGVLIAGGAINVRIGSWVGIDDRQFDRLRAQYETNCHVPLPNSVHAIHRD